MKTNNLYDEGVDGCLIPAHLNKMTEEIQILCVKK